MIPKPMVLIFTGLAISGCAYGPSVTEVTEANFREIGEDHRQVFYALPRTKVQVTLPVKTRTLRCGLLHWANAEANNEAPSMFPGDCPKNMSLEAFDHGNLTFDGNALRAGIKCSLGDSIASENRCSWSFKRKRLAGNKRLLKCKLDESMNPAQVDVVLSGDPSVELLTVPDQEQIYAVSLTPRKFERLKLGMEFAANGSATRLSSTSSSALADVAQNLIGTTIGGVIDLELFDAEKDVASYSIKFSGAEDIYLSAIEKVIDQIVELEKDRLRLTRLGEGNSDVYSSIIAEQERLRGIIEGGVHEEEKRLRLTFDPPDRVPSKTSYTKTIEIEKFDPCSENSSGKKVRVALVLENDKFSSKWVEVQDGNSSSGVGGDDLGFRYRVPQQASAELRICYQDTGVDVDSAECIESLPSSSIEVANSLAINQLGIVRSLPRRLGWWSGALGVSLDPSTGALNKISSESSGSVQQTLISAAKEASKDQDLDALEREKTELELRVSICKSRLELGLPLPSDCPNG